MGFWSKNKGNVESTKSSGIDGADFFYPIGAGASYIGGSLDNARRLAFFMQVPELNAILALRARAAGNMRLLLVDKDTEEPVKLSVTDPVLDILQEPNYFQSKEEFFGQTNLFRDIFGNEYIHLQKPYGMAKPTAIFTLPPPFVKVENTGAKLPAPFFTYSTVPDQLVYKYQDEWNNAIILDKAKLLHMNDNGVKYGTTPENNYLIGQSKIDALQAPLENIIAAYEARNVLIVNRGAIGILSNAAKDGIGGVAPLDGKEKEKVQREFSKYGLTKSQWQVIITNLSLNWQQMAIDVDKLRLFEETLNDTFKVCDSFGVPFELLASQNSSSMTDKRNASVQFYRETIIPETSARISGINKKFLGNRPYKLFASFEHLAVFQEELTNRSRSLMLTANALSRALDGGVITPDEYRYELKKFNMNLVGKAPKPVKTAVAPIATQVPWYLAAPEVIAAPVVAPAQNTDVTL